MPPSRVSKNSSFRRRKLLKTSGVGREVMRPCKNCAAGNRPCKVGESSDKCLECVRLGRKCDLSFSPAEYRRLKEKRDEARKAWKQACAEAAAANAKVLHLAQQYEQLEAREQEMVENEWRNIAELEEEEHLNEFPTDSFPLDLSSEQVEFPSDWDTVLMSSAVVPSGTSS